MVVQPLTNRCISTTKNTALGSVVSLNGILNNAQSASSNAGNPTPLTLGALAYLAIFIPVILLARRIETRWHWRTCAMDALLTSFFTFDVYRPVLPFLLTALLNHIGQSDLVFPLSAEERRLGQERG